MSTEKEVLEQLLETGTKKFSKVKKSDKKLYGKLHSKESLLAFCQYLNPEFQAPDHIKLIIEKLEQVAKGKITRLMINLPPRHGKSELSSKLFPVWFLGNNPKAEIIVASHAEKLANKFTRFQRNTIEQKDYTDIFPEIKQGAKWESGEWEIESGGSVIGAGVDGQVIGRGADLVLLDDVFKNYEAAISELNQETVWNWYRYVLRTRLSPGARIIIVNTRWVTGDLCGRILEHDGVVENGGKWNLLKLPAINSMGVPLWKERYPIEELQDIRENIGEKIFGSVYQQEPVDIQERLFLDPKFSTVPTNLKMFAYLDPAFGGNDSSALTLGALVPAVSPSTVNTIFIFSGHLWKSQIDETYNRVEKICKKNDVRVLYVESNAAQIAVANEFEKRKIIVKQIRNSTNKHLRIMNAVKVNWSRIFFSHSVEADYMKQVLNYSELSIHDDAPDSLAGLVDAITANDGNKIMNRYNFITNFRRRI